jgi:phosphatidylglycerol---prolipoprotein diacylglyceryl transferase
MGLDGERVQNLWYLSGLAALVGARLGFVVQNWAVFSSNPSAVFALAADGFAPLWGLAFAGIAGVAYAQRRGLDNPCTLDALTPALLVAAAGLAVAGMASGNSYGSPTTVPWAITLWGARRHPLPVYEFIAICAIAIMVLRRPPAFDGAWFGSAVALYALALLVLGAWAGNTTTVAGLRLPQLVSLAVLLADLVLLRHWVTQKAS